MPKYTEETLSIVASNLTAAYFASIPDQPTYQNHALNVDGEENLPDEPTRVQQIIHEYNFIRESLKDHPEVNLES
jgi:hypothetical protein